MPVSFPPACTPCPDLVTVRANGSVYPIAILAWGHGTCPQRWKGVGSTCSVPFADTLRSTCATGSSPSGAALRVLCQPSTCQGSCCLQSLHWALSPSTVVTTNSQEGRWQQGHPPAPAELGLGAIARLPTGCQPSDSVPQLPWASTSFPSSRRRSRAWLGAAVEGFYVSSAIPYF